MGKFAVLNSDMSVGNIIVAETKEIAEQFTNATCINVDDVFLNHLSRYNAETNEWYQVEEPSVEDSTLEENTEE